GKGKTFNATGYLEYAILDGLLFKTSYTTNYVDGAKLVYDRRGSTFNTTGSRRWNDNKSAINVWENTLTYAQTYGKHDIKALAGFSMEKSSSLRYSMNATNFPDDVILNDFSSAANIGSISE